MAKRKPFRGTGTALVTPFKRDGSLDEKALRRLVDFQIKNGVEALIPVGMISASLAANERVSFEGFYQYKWQETIADPVGSYWSTSDGVGDGVVILQPEQRREFFLIKLFHAHAHVVRKHEIEENLLLAVKVCADDDFGLRGAFLAG